MEEEKRPLNPPMSQVAPVINLPLKLSNDKTNEETQLHSGHKPLYYGVEDVPPVHTSILFGFQQVFVCVSGVISMPLVVSDLICASHNVMARVKLIGTMLFVTGFSTILQSTFGTRLPLLQGPSASFLPPIVVLMSLPEFKCPDEADLNSTNSSAHGDDAWMDRMTLVQGGLISAAVVQMLIGFTGLIGVITRHIGPLTIAPLMMCLELSLVEVVLRYAGKHWMSLIIIVLVLLMAFYIGEFLVPIPSFNWRQRNFQFHKVPIFALFPYIIAVVVTWVICWIVTVSGGFSNGSAARTDTHSHILADAPWFRWPYPCQWGYPSVNVAAFVGMVAGTIGSVIESVGDYHACARVCQQRPPPSHAVNRGIFIEGFCCFVGGLLGGGTSVTTYSENIGVIGITKVGSRRVLQVAGCIFLLLGCFTKVGAILANIPDPLVGGILFTSMSMVGGVGLSSVQAVDLHLTRNMAILGLSLMTGMLVPKWVAIPGQISTGVDPLDQLLQIILGTNMIVGGVTGFILDNTFPGATRDQRGLHQAEEFHDDNIVKAEDHFDVYDFNFVLYKKLPNFAFARYLPIMPRFQGWSKRKSPENHVA